MSDQKKAEALAESPRAMYEVVKFDARGGRTLIERTADADAAMLTFATIARKESPQSQGLTVGQRFQINDSAGRLNAQWAKEGDGFFLETRHEEGTAAFRVAEEVLATRWTKEREDLLLETRHAESTVILRGPAEVLANDEAQSSREGDEPVWRGEWKSNLEGTAELRPVVIGSEGAFLAGYEKSWGGGESERHLQEFGTLPSTLEHAKHRAGTLVDDAIFSDTLVVDLDRHVRYELPVGPRQTAPTMSIDVPDLNTGAVAEARLLSTPISPEDYTEIVAHVNKGRTDASHIRVDVAQADRTYTGPVIYETETHMLQQVGKGMGIVHERALVQGQLNDSPRTQYEIAYGKSAGKLMAISFEKSNPGPTDRATVRESQAQQAQR